MNNSYIIKDNILEAPENIDNSATLRKQEQELLEVIEALESIKGSNFWKLVEQKVFAPNLSNLVNKLIQEKEDKTMFRLQGQIQEATKLADLGSLLLAKRNALKTIRNSLK